MHISLINRSIQKGIAFDMTSDVKKQNINKQDVKKPTKTSTNETKIKQKIRTNLKCNKIKYL